MGCSLLALLNVGAARSLLRRNYDRTMCYSAQVKTEYETYLRMTGAEMDLAQFLEIFGARAAGQNIRIPRGFERNFDHPKSPTERAIKDAIDQYRASTTSKLETEIFAQKRRLADAQRKLAVKPTKAAAESQRIATSKIQLALDRLPLLKNSAPHEKDARIFPMSYSPIVIQEGAARWLRLARYHCRLPGKPSSTDRQLPGLYNARRDNIEGYWRPAFGSAHAVMLAESFFENVEREGKNVVLHFMPRPANVMFVACVYSEWSDPKEGKLLSFAAITDEPPAEVAAAGHDRMIINIKQDNLGRWLSPQGVSPAELHAILQDRETPYYEHEVLAA